MLVGQSELAVLKSRLNYYVRKGKLLSLRRGIYAKSETYDRFELATKIYTPSYISLETVLQKESLIFQYYHAISVVSYLSREIVCDNQTYIFRKIKDEILIDLAGIEQKDNYFMASKERALLDTLYLYKNYHFDNLEPVNWDLCFEILPIYRQKELTRRVDVLYRENKNA